MPQFWQAIRHPRLALRLQLIVASALLCLLVLSGVTVAQLYRVMLDARVDKLRALTDQATSVAGELEKLVRSGGITRAQAIQQFRDAVRPIRYDGGAGYFISYGMDGMTLVQGPTPEIEGTNRLGITDADGKLWLQAMISVSRQGGGTVVYRYPKPGSTLAQPKLTYVQPIPGWDMFVATGLYIDDLNAAVLANIVRFGAWVGVLVLICVMVAWTVSRGITRPLSSLRRSMASLAHGNLATAVAGVGRRDEIGGMAEAVQVFKDHMIEAQRLVGEQEQERERVETAKHAALVGMAETIESEAGSALTAIGHRTAEMAETANAMSASSRRTGASAQSAAAAATQALANAQTVASAAEQLATSIREIGDQVSKSTAVVGRAVEAGRITRERMEALNEHVGRIGAVADMIGEIAAKTNLLALNATIEAARAGDAGKGFAVVASEVKQLAAQTAKSTGEISRHIDEVRAATGASVAAVGHIEQTIGEINEISGSIAAAVEEQGAATAEIARNVTETAAAAGTMTERTEEVSTEATRTGQQAAEVLQGTTALDAAVHGLRETVIHLVRTSTPEVDRRRHRRRPCLVEATISSQGQSDAALLHDVSEQGCYAITKLHWQVGSLLDIGIARFGHRLQGKVVEQIDQRLHVAFSGDGLSAAEADRLSLETTKDMVGLARSDHVTFVKRVADAVATRTELPPESLAMSHQCRFGKWYDHVSDPISMALPSFKAINTPHHHVHEAGRRALVALAVQDMATAERHVAEMRRESENVLRCLDEFGRDFPATVSTDVVIAA